MQVNQKGDRIREHPVITDGKVIDYIDPSELETLIALLCKKLKVNVIRTNATDSGEYEFQLEDN